MLVVSCLPPPQVKTHTTFKAKSWFVVLNVRYLLRCTQAKGQDILKGKNKNAHNIKALYAFCKHRLIQVGGPGLKLAEKWKATEAPNYGYFSLSLQHKSDHREAQSFSYWMTVSRGITSPMARCLYQNGSSYGAPCARKMFVQTGV